MFAVKGIYTGGDTIQLERDAVPVREKYEVVVTFLEKIEHIPENEETPIDADLERRRAGFERMSKYHKTLRTDFDYKKELAEYREERYGSTN
jgi:hypothetical protein